MNLIQLQHAAEVAPNNVKRLAKALKLDIEGKSDNSVVGLVWWKISSFTSRFDSEEKKADYTKMWENL